MTYSGSKASSGCKIYINAVQSDVANAQGGVYTGMSNTTNKLGIGNNSTVGNRIAGIFGIPIIYKGYEAAQAEITRVYTRQRHLFGV